MDHYKFQDERIVLTATDSDLSTPDGTCTFVALRQLDLKSTANATLCLQSLQAKAGLAVYKDDYRHAEIFFDPSFGAVCFMAKNFPPSGDRIVTMDIIPSEKIHFAIHATETRYDFRFRQSNEKEWHSISTLDTKLMTANDFTGTLFSIYTSGVGEAVFENFRAEKS